MKFKDKMWNVRFLSINNVSNVKYRAQSQSQTSSSWIKKKCAILMFLLWRLYLVNIFIQKNKKYCTEIFKTTIHLEQLLTPRTNSWSFAWYSIVFSRWCMDLENDAWTFASCCRVCARQRVAEKTEKLDKRCGQLC